MLLSSLKLPYDHLPKYINGPEGHPNNLPQPAWHLAELFFWSDLSWSQADLCPNSYVISTRFCLLSMMPSCTPYISNIGIGRIIHSILFRISMHGLFVTLDPTEFQVTCDCSYFFEFWIICTDQIISRGVVFNENKTVLTDSLLIWALSTVCLGIW